MNNFMGFPLRIFFIDHILCLFFLLLKLFFEIFLQCVLISYLAPTNSTQIHPLSLVSQLCVLFSKHHV